MFENVDSNNESSSFLLFWFFSMGSFCWSNLTFFRYPLGYFSEIPFDFCFYSGRSISSSELWEGNTLSLALFYSRLDFPNSTSEPMKLGF